MNAPHKHLFRSDIYSLITYPPLIFIIAFVLLFFAETLPITDRIIGGLLGIVIGLAAAFMFWKEAQREKRADEIARQMQRPSDENLSALLRQIFDFTEDELSLNRNSVISDRQQSTLKKRHVNFIHAHTILLLVMLNVIAIGYVWIQLLDSTSSTYQNQVTQIIILGGVIVVLLAILAIYSFMQWRKVSLSAILSFTGQAEIYLTVSRGGSVTGSHLKIDKKKLRLSLDQTRAFWHGAHYRIYTAGGRILSAELVE
jgi:membrane-associated HD superfamily phosphohydrolase